MLGEVAKKNTRPTLNLKTMNTDTIPTSNLVKNGNKSKSLLQDVFSFNERVIWDSRFGYEIGYFLGEGWVYDTYLIDIRTGRIVKECCHSKSEVHKYSDELISELTKKYGYEKRFSDTF